MNKRRLVLACALVLLVALMATGTVAYISTEAHMSNIITTGTIEITLNDEITGGEQTETGWKLEGVMPGVDVEKIVSVTNDGSADAWIRVALETTITKDGVVLPATFGDKLPAVIIGIDGENWIAGEEGYYYYKLPMAQNDETEPLFRTVKLNELLPNAYQGCVVNIDVTAEAVQVKNNNNGGELTELTAENYADVLGWPAAAETPEEEPPAEEEIPVEEVPADEVPVEETPAAE